ncbi:MAG: methionyl-tRNA formyltransferase [Chloroflexota bacterium]
MGARTRTIFLGSGSFALPALAALTDSRRVELVAVVTAPPRPAGRKGQLRPTPVAAAAADLAIDVLAPTRLRDAQTQQDLAALGADLVVLADYGRLVPGEALDLPAHGALNLHPSLLPRHRGASPVPAAILGGDTVTGVTLMRMDVGLDTGPIIAQVEMVLDGTELAPNLEATLAQMGAELLLASLADWLDGSLEARPQSDVGATLTRPLRRADGWLDPARPAAELERQVRAYQPWPGSFLEVDGERLIVWSADIVAPPAQAEVGSLEPIDDGLVLVTSSGALRLAEVQPAGKRRMGGADYRRGRRH